MQKYQLSIFVGSTMLTHDSDTMYGIVNALRDLACHLPEYTEVIANNEKIDTYIEQLVQLKNGVKPAVLQSSPFLRIEYFTAS